jgi:hypothetical protein
MSTGATKLRFALDHNFPGPVLDAFAVMLPNVELIPLVAIDEALADVDDWELFLALHRHPQRWDGLVTNDDKLLSLPKEMTVLSQTRLTLVVTVGEGHSPIRAVGLLLCHLNHICHHSKPDRAQVWRLSVRQKDHEDPRKYLEEIAERAGTTADAIFQAHKVPARALRPPRE